MNETKSEELNMPIIYLLLLPVLQILSAVLINISYNSKILLSQSNKKLASFFGVIISFHFIDNDLKVFYDPFSLLSESCNLSINREVFIYNLNSFELLLRLQQFLWLSSAYGKSSLLFVELLLVDK